MRDDRERLLDTQEAIERIGKYAARGRQTFEGDELVQTWIVHYLSKISIHNYPSLDSRPQKLTTPEAHSSIYSLQGLSLRSFVQWILSEVLARPPICRNFILTPLKTSERILFVVRHITRRL